MKIDGLVVPDSWLTDARSAFMTRPHFRAAELAQWGSQRLHGSGLKNHMLNIGWGERFADRCISTWRRKGLIELVTRKPFPLWRFRP